MSEARRRHSVTAKVRTLCSRQHGGVPAWSPADAPLALDQTRYFDREAIRDKGRAAGPRRRKDQDRGQLCAGPKEQVDGDRSGRTLLFQFRGGSNRGFGAPESRKL